MLGHEEDEATGGVFSPEGRLAPGLRSDGVLQATSKTRMLNHANRQRKRDMGMIVLEALVAGGILVLIVWWTMFSGRDRGEPKKPDHSE
jgi:hypothetical protein